MGVTCVEFIESCILLNTAIWDSKKYTRQQTVVFLFFYSATMKPKVPPPLPPKASEGGFVAQNKRDAFKNK